MEPSRYYHIYNHANGFENLFQSAENYRFFLEKWGKYVEPVADTYAYCLMPNHFHALVKVKQQDELEVAFGKFQTFRKLEYRISKQFANFFSSYTQAFNKMYERKGSLFQPNFKAKEIITDAYLTNIIFYIHHNPLHHGFCKDIADWPHSSYHALVSDKLTRVKRKEVQDWFGSKEELKNFHSQAITGLEKLENEFT
jgi:putative transposase